MNRWGRNSERRENKLMTRDSKVTRLCKKQNKIMKLFKKYGNMKIIRNKKKCTKEK